MKVDVDERGSLTRPQLDKKIDAVLELIRENPDPVRSERLQVLARSLLTYSPANYLFSHKKKQIVEWIETFLDFMEQRREKAAVRTGSFGDSDRCFLMTTSPDAVHLLDSIQAFLNREGYRFHLIAHPILAVRRQRGRIVKFGEIEDLGSPRESFILMELDKGISRQCPLLNDEISTVLRATLDAERDRNKLTAALGRIGKGSHDNHASEFFGWLHQGNFLPFAYRCLYLQKNGEWTFSKGAPDLGMSLAESKAYDQAEGELDDFEPICRERLMREPDIVVEAMETISPVHRAEPLVYIGYREQESSGEIVEHAFFGLFSQRSSTTPISTLPVLYKKIEAALGNLHIPKGCYDYRKTLEIFDTFPRVELFFMEQHEIAQMIHSFISLQRQGSVNVVVTRSLSLHGLTLLVIMPKEFYTPLTLQRMENYLCRYFKAKGAESRIIHVYTDYLSIHVNLRPEEDEVKVEIDRLETALTDLVRPWESRLRRLLDRLFGRERGNRLWHRYGEGFPDEYRSVSHPRYAVRDFLALERLHENERDRFDLWGPFKNDRGAFYRLQFYSFRESNLNELMPILENLNLIIAEEVDFNVNVRHGGVAYIKSFTIRGPSDCIEPLNRLKENLLDALEAVWSKRCENDYLNRLLVLTGLSWQEIDIYRGYRNYYFQLGIPFTKKRVAFALIHNPRIAELLIRYFESRFKPEKRWEDPMVREDEALSPLRLQLVEALEEVDDINEDRILRSLFNLMDSTVRTNFFKRVGTEGYFFSFKISAIGIIDMAFPRPLYETYVHSAGMEGIHLRGGKVARGGIRWSDRPDDFRTEVLGLMKTQMTKNTLIVPVGSKGGFVVKKSFASREKGAQLSRAAYMMFMRGLLDLTDNRVEGTIEHPEGIVAYDGEDPYLVVAADKGTAHLSDTANEISAEYDFWLGDAFASGGSRGYDHKELGITARGAWVCVERHFRELGIDIQSEPFTVVGVGDMSGDVFGNGMLLSEQIRLLAAFDHRHIFIDPDPDPAVSFSERQRLFRMGRSSWEDYDKSLISEGGGVWPRQTKEIPLSPQVREWLGVRHNRMEGQDLIRAILAAPADLFWNGGIGTYVKASSEKNEDAGDRANDAVRIDGRDVRARVVGEGGNLGFTQKGRIEFALAGGCINTDAIDNSGGVDSSDHEVNLKILMKHAIEQGRVGSREERDTILQRVTEEVCDDVLANNYTQSLALSLDLARCRKNPEPFIDLINRLVNAGLLDRQSEFLPTRKEILARDCKCLSRPELAILLAYAKMQLYEDLLESDLPDTPAMQDMLLSYFPNTVCEQFGEEILNHPLSREITATVLTNFVIDRSGSTFLNSLGQQTSRTWIEGVRTYLFFDRVMEAEPARQALFDLDNRMDAEVQSDVLMRQQDALADLCTQWLDTRESPDCSAGPIAEYRRKVEEYQKGISSIVPQEHWQVCQKFIENLQEQGASESLARDAALFEFMDDFLPLVDITEATGRELHSTATALKDVRKAFRLPELLDHLKKVPERDRWDRMNRKGLESSLQSSTLQMTRKLTEECNGNLETYMGQHKQKIRYFRTLRDQILTTTPVNYHPFSVLARNLDDLAAE
ncbi:MAG: NAD-glutamate dehydrogenase [Desulfuromonadales bacterium]